MRISDWSSDVCSSDLAFPHIGGDRHEAAFLLVEIEEVRLVWHAHQAAVVAVDPVVVIAGGARGAAALGQHGSVANIVKLEQDRKSVVWGKSVSVRVDLGGGRIIKKKKNKKNNN